MLSRLSVSNLAVVEKAEADFAPGLNVLTGETGAGKSVLMGALELVLGGRADASAVRDGAKELRVEAAFDLSKSSAAVRRAVACVLEEAGLPACEEGVLVIRRTVSAPGGGRVWANDAATTVATLRRLGRLLVDIHGARANQAILEEDFQRDALDALANLAKDPAKAAYAAAYASWRALVAEEESLRNTESSADALDLLRFQVAEFDEAALSADDGDLGERHAAAAHAAELVERANEITEALGGDAGAAELVRRLQPTFSALARHVPAAAAWGAAAEEAVARIEDLSRTVAEAAGRMEVDPEEFAEMDARLGTVNRLKRKYGAATVKDLLETAERKRAKLAGLERREERLAELAEAVGKARAAAEAAGAKLSAKRRAAAAKVAKAVTGELKDLGFAQAKFGVRVEPADPAPHGCDRVAYVFEPNPGEGARLLSEIASSGEAARVMLALKGILSAHDATDVLVFDEIDANVGGEIGSVVGAKMRAVAEHHQVIAITHLPQSAVWGGRHLVVTKRVSGGRTRTEIAEAAGERRVREIARMLGGEKSTSVVLRHAAEMLERVEDRCSAG